MCRIVGIHRSLSNRRRHHKTKLIKEAKSVEISLNLPLVSADVVVSRRGLQVPRRRLDERLFLDRRARRGQRQNRTQGENGSEEPNPAKN